MINKNSFHHQAMENVSMELANGLWLKDLSDDLEQAKSLFVQAF